MYHNSKICKVYMRVPEKKENMQGAFTLAWELFFSLVREVPNKQLSRILGWKSFFFQIFSVWNFRLVSKTWGWKRLGLWRSRHPIRHWQVVGKIYIQWTITVPNTDVRFDIYYYKKIFILMKKSPILLSIRKRDRETLVYWPENNCGE